MSSVISDGKNVTFAIPPRFNVITEKSLFRNNHSSIFGIRGAPVPPASISAVLKSDITGTFNFFAK